MAFDIYPWAEHHVNALPTRLLANRGANTLDQLRIERAGKRRSRGKTRRRAAFRNAHAILGALLLAQSVRSVGEKQARDAGAWSVVRFPVRLAGKQLSPLLKRKAAHPQGARGR